MGAVVSLDVGGAQLGAISKEGRGHAHVDRAALLNVVAALQWQFDVQLLHGALNHGVGQVLLNVVLVGRLGLLAALANWGHEGLEE